LLVGRSHFGARLPLALLAASACALAASAQYPGQVSGSNSAPNLRAVSVYEWTGDEQHPKASRLIPITVFDGQQLQDGGIYLASPAPVSLETDVEYQLKDDGKNVGLYVVETASRDLGSWVGHGSFKDMPKPKPIAPAMWKGDEDDAASDEPVLHRKAHPGESSGSASSGSGSSGSPSQGGSGPAPDPDRPTLHRDDSADAGAPSNAPAPDPDRPTMTTGSSNSGSTGSNNPPAAASGNAPSTGPDRPKLQPQKGDDDSYVESAGSADPDRPQIVRGKTAYAGPSVLPAFIGLPPDMSQTVAVSDAHSRAEHVWSYSWANSADQAKYKGQLEDLARTALGLTPAKKVQAKSGPAKATPAKIAPGHKTRLTLPPAPPELFDEQFHVFELAYGSGATIVFSAHTAGTGADEKFVTLIAQPDLYGDLTVLVKNVTDGAHLDQTPRMRLIDAVDAMADNRGELLFELRGATERQFALYRVLRGQATELFVTGSREFASPIPSTASESN
jgi:hypothetical protein